MLYNRWRWSAFVASDMYSSLICSQFCVAVPTLGTPRILRDVRIHHSTLSASAHDLCLQNHDAVILSMVGRCVGGIDGWTILWSAQSPCCSQLVCCPVCWPHTVVSLCWNYYLTAERFDSSYSIAARRSKLFGHVHIVFYYMFNRHLVAYHRMTFGMPHEKCRFVFI